VDADAKQHALLGRHPFIAACTGLLHREGDADGGLHARELEHQAIAETLDKAPLVPGQQPMHDVIDEAPPAPDSAFLVLLYQADLLDHVDKEHRPHDAGDVLKQWQALSDHRAFPPFRFL
jgi:hypothetical protein